MEDERQEKNFVSSLSPLQLFHRCLSVVLSFLHSINIYSAPAIVLAAGIAVVSEANMIPVLIGTLKNEWRGGAEAWKGASQHQVSGTERAVCVWNGEL